MARAGLGGVVLAGGRARRFGSDKALAVVDGQTLLARAVACLREVCAAPVLVASGDGVRRPGVADGQVADLVPDAGPLSAIAGALAAFDDGVDAVVVLAVDHVAPSPALLALLADRRGDAVCAAAEVGGRLQPLHAVWRRGAAPDLAAAVTDGQRAVVGWLAGRPDVVVLGEGELAAAGVDPAAVRDADVPGDLPG